MTARRTRSIRRYRQFRNANKKTPGAVAPGVGAEAISRIFVNSSFGMAGALLVHRAARVNALAAIGSSVAALTASEHILT